MTDEPHTHPEEAEARRVAREADRLPVALAGRRATARSDRDEAIGRFFDALTKLAETGEKFLTAVLEEEMAERRQRGA